MPNSKIKPNIFRLFNRFVSIVPEETTRPTPGALLLIPIK
ncbi:hypothetical protein LEP1GSC043_1866 [Leptospira weilii str. Ecochallenge]|nr:hypothetical protein LEP1GSC086_3387 [Leptospira weilii str. LNT 1234]EMY15635.1 hypothetical protein LEP1GSC043_1866 [Leptospira weilii str. Ecochallenge]